MVPRIEEPNFIGEKRSLFCSLLLLSYSGGGEISFKRNQLALRKHLNIHKETYKCEVCQKLFQTRYMLTRHQKVHDKRKDFSCTCCNAKFSIKSNLNRHYKNAHDKQWLAYNCVYVHVVRELIFSFFVMMSQLFQVCSADPKRGGWQGQSLVPVPTHTVPGATQIEGIGSTNFGRRS